MSFKHLDIVERERLFGMLEKGYSHRKIAEVLGRSQSSISREISKNTKYGRKYIPIYANRRAKRVGDRQRRKAPLKDPEVFLYVRSHLRAPFFWSPETISGRIKREIPGVSITPESIYRYIYGSSKRKNTFAKYLVRKHSKRRVQTGRLVHKVSKIQNAISIYCRAKYIVRRKQIGHWESDLMEGPRSSKPVLSVTTERSTRYTVITKLSSKHAINKTLDLVKRLKTFPRKGVKTLTLDNGSENSFHQEVSKQLSIKVFFCHPYHSWEKGTVENTIGRIRRYLPKGTNLTDISDEKIAELEYILNNTPRRCLGYLTPYEKMSMELRKIEVSN